MPTHSAHHAPAGAAYTRMRRAYRKITVHPDEHTLKQYGTSYRMADKMQKQARVHDAYYGDGAYRRGRRVHRRRRRQYRYRGDGGFWGDVWGGVKKVGKALMPVAESFLPPKFQGVAHALFDQNNDDDTGDYSGEYGGSGAYGPMTTNAIVHGNPGNSQGIVAHTADQGAMSDSGDIMLSHKEFMCNIIIQAGTDNQTQSQFQNQEFALNPGLPSTFPFLSQIAQCFTLYSMQGLMFQYKPTSGEMGINSTQLGKVIMATDYDPQAVPFINAVQMENYQFSNSAKPSIGQIHGVECKPAESLLDMKYMRTGQTKRDLALTDIGLFQIATEGIPFPTGVKAGQQIVIGELWASYSCKVSRANLYGSLLGQNIQFANIINTITTAKAVASAAPIASNIVSQYELTSGNLALVTQNSNTLGVAVTLYNSWPGINCSTNFYSYW